MLIFGIKLQRPDSATVHRGALFSTLVWAAFMALYKLLEIPTSPQEAAGVWIGMMWCTLLHAIGIRARSGPKHMAIIFAGCLVINGTAVILL